MTPLNIHAHYDGNDGDDDRKVASIDNAHTDNNKDNKKARNHSNKT